LLTYVVVLTQRASGAINFRTGTGRIFRDLLVHWPTLEDWEEEAQELCQKIADAVYPLASALYAQGVEINITISPTPLPAPTQIEAMATYLLFDTEQKIERHSFLSPHHSLPQTSLLALSKGITVLCRPLNLHYHEVEDDKSLAQHTYAGIFELPQRIINEIYEQSDYIPREQQIIATLKTQIATLPLILETADAAARETVPPPTKKLGPDFAITSEKLNTISLWVLPPALRDLERRLVAYMTDKNISATLRYDLRRLAQVFRTLYPMVMLIQAGRYDTEPVVVPTQEPTDIGLEKRAADSLTNPAYRHFPKAAMAASVGKLDKVANADIGQNLPLPNTKLPGFRLRPPPPGFTSPTD
jgi:hypothetical protein